MSGEGREDGGEEDRDRLSDGFLGEGRGDGVAPELIAHTADRGRGGGIWDACKFEVEGPYGKVGRTRVGREKCGEDIRRMVILSDRAIVRMRFRAQRRV